MEVFRLDSRIILVVDDTSLMRANHKRMLMNIGFKESNLYFANDGAEALSGLAKIIQTRGRVDLIICDWDMPKVTGVQVLQMIKKVPSSKIIPFLMVTGHTKKEDIVKVLKMGVDGYVMKPFKEDSFSAKVLEALITGFIRM